MGIPIALLAKLLLELHREADTYWQARGKWKWYRSTHPAPKTWHNGPGGVTHRLTPQQFALAFENYLQCVHPSAVRLLVCMELQGMGTRLAGNACGLSREQVRALLGDATHQPGKLAEYYRDP